jgi:hypothetical protein
MREKVERQNRLFRHAWAFLQHRELPTSIAERQPGRLGSLYHNFRPVGDRERRPQNAGGHQYHHTGLPSPR